jgi:hypothetical protein
MVPYYIPYLWVASSAVGSYFSLQDRQLAKNIFFLANNFGKSRHFSHDELIRVVTCRQMGHPSRQLLFN